MGWLRRAGLVLGTGLVVCLIVCAAPLRVAIWQMISPVGQATGEATRSLERVVAGLRARVDAQLASAPVMADDMQLLAEEQPGTLQLSDLGQALGAAWQCLGGSGVSLGTLTAPGLYDLSGVSGATQSGCPTDGLAAELEGVQESLNDVTAGQSTASDTAGQNLGSIMGAVYGSSGSITAAMGDYYSRLSDDVGSSTSTVVTNVNNVVSDLMYVNNDLDSQLEALSAQVASISSDTTSDSVLGKLGSWFGQFFGDGCQGDSGSWGSWVGTALEQCAPSNSTVQQAEKALEGAVKAASDTAHSDAQAWRAAQEDRDDAAQAVRSAIKSLAERIATATEAAESQLEGIASKLGQIASDVHNQQPAPATDESGVISALGGISSKLDGIADALTAGESDGTGEGWDSGSTAGDDGGEKLEAWENLGTCLVIPTGGDSCHAGPTININGFKWQPLSWCDKPPIVDELIKAAGAVLVIMSCLLAAKWVFSGLGIAPAQGSD